MDIVRITRIVPECERVSTVMFKWDAQARPGQFVMVWVPGHEEVPMSLSYTGAEKGFTAENRGPTTARIHELAVGDKLGIRGPFGNGFSGGGESVLVVGGGTGAAPLAPLVENLCTSGKNVMTALGARTICDLVFLQRLEAAGCTVHQATDDGSEGHHGFVTELAFQLLAEHQFDRIYACGPEPMLVELVELAGRHGIHIECSLERYMKCGMGICDSCALDGLQVCKDGPVFDGHTLQKSEEFGRLARSRSGQKVQL